MTATQIFLGFLKYRLPRGEYIFFRNRINCIKRKGRLFDRERGLWSYGHIFPTKRLAECCLWDERAQLYGFMRIMLEYICPKLVYEKCYNPILYKKVKGVTPSNLKTNYIRYYTNLWHKYLLEEVEGVNCTVRTPFSDPYKDYEFKLKKRLI